MRKKRVLGIVILVLVFGSGFTAMGIVVGFIRLFIIVGASISITALIMVGVNMVVKG